jgi:hypothetical protein
MYFSLFECDMVSCINSKWRNYDSTRYILSDTFLTVEKNQTYQKFINSFWVATNFNISFYKGNNTYISIISCCWNTDLLCLSWSPYMDSYHGANGAFVYGNKPLNQRVKTSNSSSKVTLSITEKCGRIWVCNKGISHFYGGRKQRPPQRFTQDKTGRISRVIKEKSLCASTSSDVISGNWAKLLSSSETESFTKFRDQGFKFSWKTDVAVIQEGAGFYIHVDCLL